METLSAIFDRRSVRHYQKMSVPDEVVNDLLKAAMYAPSARNTQSWQFIVVRERSMLNAIMQVHPYSTMLEKAPLAILICGDKTLEPHEGYLCQNCSAATQNVLLAAQDLGLGAVWLGVYPRKERMDPLTNLFALPEDIIPISLVAAGYTDMKFERPERFLQERIHYEKW